MRRMRRLAAHDVWRCRNSYKKEVFALLLECSGTEPNVVVKEAIASSVQKMPRKENLGQCIEIYENLCAHPPTLETYDTSYHPFQSSIYDLWIHTRHPWTEQKVSNWLSNCWDMATPLSAATFRALQYLAPEHHAKEASVKSSVKFLEQAIDAVVPVLLEKGKEPVPEDQKEKETREKKAQKLYGIIDNIASRAYFDSGVYDPDAKKGNRVKKVDSKYFSRTNPLIHQIARLCSETNLVQPRTTNYLIEYLQGIAPFAPAECLSLALQIVKGSTPLGFHLDSIGAKNAVALVEVLLADHKEVLQTKKSMNDMLEFLDIFADAGWDDAIRLVWRLEEIFR